MDRTKLFLLTGCLYLFGALSFIVNYFFIEDRILWLVLAAVFLFSGTTNIVLYNKRKKQ
ncbi:hypothetical protein [Cohnella yongneupensis]|uniref:YrhK domain-containing protein n=1 Tax=Cohnella yongneupensis TaxID=425006 RepID=A0ABW0QVZ7_9BACL